MSEIQISSDIIFRLQKTKLFLISFRESLFKRDCFCYDNPWRKNLNKREKYEGADWIMHFIGHFKTITRHKILVAKGCFKLGLYYQGIMHDMSKYSPTEFLVGVKYYQGTESPNNAERMEEGISMSWLHHKDGTNIILNIGLITALIKTIQDWLG